MKPNKKVLEAIKKYDKRLYVKWNNERHVFEVWRSMPWGARLITPLTLNIYEPGLPQKFCPLDYRIMEWLYSADSQRKGRPLCWKWQRKKNILKEESLKKKRLSIKLKEFAQESYYLVNNELINKSVQVEDTGWKRPELQSRATKRVMFRKEYYDHNRDN